MPSCERTSSAFLFTSGLILKIKVVLFSMLYFNIVYFETHYGVLKYKYKIGENFPIRYKKSGIIIKYYVSVHIEHVLIVFFKTLENFVISKKRMFIKTSVSCLLLIIKPYFAWSLLLMAACAAASLATGTLNGEHDT